MKACKRYTSLGNVFSIILMVLVIFCLASCARKVSFQTSPVVPAAEGSVKIKKDKNNNYSLELNVRNLAESNRLDPPRETYVVWIDTERNGTKNLGQIKSTSGLFSSKLKASLTAVTSFKPTKVFITAEDDASTPYPGIQLILQTNRF